MNMTKLFTMAIVVAFFFAACGEANHSTAENYDKLIVGQWIQNYQDDHVGGHSILEFTMDRTLKMTGDIYSISSDGKREEIPSPNTNLNEKWRISGDTLYVIWSQSNPDKEAFPYRIDKLDKDSLLIWDDIRNNNNVLLFAGKRIK